jgi:hypothetical protein
VGVEKLRMLEFERKAKPAIGLILGHEIRAVMGSVLDVYFFLSNLHKVNGRTQPIRRNGKLCR